MKTIIENYQTMLMYAGITILIVMGAVAIAWAIWWGVRAVRRALTIKELVMFAFAATVCTYAAQKTGSIRFLMTDPDMAYLTDEGSSITDDNGGWLTLLFSVYELIPNTANIYIANKCIDPAEEEWTTQWEIPLGDIAFVEGVYQVGKSYQNATNYDWVVYTDWTPGTSVVTNGVWHINWMQDTHGRGFIIPLNTKVLINGETVAPPNRIEPKKESDEFTIEEEEYNDEE